MKRLIGFIALFFVFSNVFSQGYFNQWYFGNGASMHFNNGAPVVTNNGAMFTAEGCATFSDYNGNLLFYTDGGTVYNKNHTVMPNGTGLMGDWSSSQSALIVRMQNDSTKYYVFTKDDHLSAGDFRYSIVDMTLDGGNGDVTTKNTFLGTTFTEKMVAASASCGVWVILHRKTTAEFYAYFVDGSGIGAPVISSVGTPQSGWTGVMKVSPNNRKIALAALNQLVEVFDFDPVTGTVSNPVRLPVQSGIQPWGVCFSPSSQRLYVGEGASPASINNRVYQYDLSSGASGPIIASRTFVGNPGTPSIIVFDLQIGPDNKIYVARNLTQYLDVISSPDNLGTACNYISDGVDLGQNIGRIGLPNAIKFPSFAGPPIADQQVCIGSSVTVNVTTPGATTYDWSPKDGSVSCETCPVVTITPTQTTVYTVQINSPQSCSGTTTFQVEISDIVCSTTVIQDVSINGGSDGIASANASNGIPAYSYDWSDGQNTQTATGLTAGSYTVTITDNIGCKKACTVQISEPPPSCEPCSEVEINDLDICAILSTDPSHPLAVLDCDNGGVNNLTECLFSADPRDPTDDCRVALLANLSICQLINNDPNHPFADQDCDNGGIPNLIECQNFGDPSDPADECSVAKSSNLNICEFINFKMDHPMATLDCDSGGVNNYLECLHGLDACDADDDCKAAVRAELDLCAIINNNANHPWASLDCDEGGIINITECANGAHPGKPSDDLICDPNLCAEAIVGAIDICDELNTDPNHPIGTLDCDGDGVTNADECTDSTDPLDPCDFVDTSITLPVTADQSGCPFPCTDLSPTTTILPGNIAGQSAVEAAIKVSEVENVDTDGSIITVRIPSDPRLVFVWDIGLTQAALVPVQNSDWNYLGDNGIVHSWTFNGTGLIIAAGGNSAFGFQSFYDPQATDGQTTITATILPFSGGECKILNNTDSERLVYFE